MQQVTGNHIEFDYHRQTEIRCPHCESGWVILTVGVTNGVITNVAFCKQTGLDVPLYCPYCGKDMRED